MSTWFRTYGFGEILPEALIIGAYPTDAEDVDLLNWIGVRRVLNLCEDSEYADGARDEVTARYAQHGIQEERIRLVDFGNLPAAYLDTAVGEVSSWLDGGELTYVHCRAGWQRSATVAAAVVAQRQHLTPDEAVAFVKAAKPTADPLPHQLEDLIAWHAAQASASDEAGSETAATPPRGGDEP